MEWISIMYRGSVYRCRNIEQDGIDPYRICGDLSAIVGVHLSVGIGDRENPQYKNRQNAGKKEKDRPCVPAMRPGLFPLFMIIEKRASQKEGMYEVFKWMLAAERGLCLLYAGGGVFFRDQGR